MTKTTVIYGLPGTGKTTALIRVLEQLMQEGYLPSEICVNTFRRSMAQEFIDRARAKFGDIDTPWMGTMHSICYSLMGKDPDIRVAEGKDFSKFFKEVFNLEYREKNGDEMLDEHIDIQKDAAKAIKDVYHIVVNATCKPDPSNWRDIVEECGNTNLLSLDDRQVELFFDEWPEWKRRHNLIDFNDMLLYVYENALSPETPVVIADEFQDFGALQYRIFRIWRNDADLSWVAGDPFQCIPEGSKVLTPVGWVNIEDIMVGERVLSAVGRHRVDTDRVIHIHKAKGKVKIIKFTTESGKVIEVTDEHRMFVYLPEQKQGSDKFWMVYLMCKTRNGRKNWRLGISKEPQKRVRMENADLCFVLATLPSKRNARIVENVLAYTYGIPQTLFKSRGEGDLDQEALDIIYRYLDTEKKARKLLRDRGIDIRYPVYVSDTSTNRLTIKIELCHFRELYEGSRREDKFRTNHWLYFSTTNANIAKILELNGIKVCKSKKISRGKEYTLYRTSKYSSNLRDLIDLALKIKEILEKEGYHVEIQHFAKLGSIRKDGRLMKSMVVPARNIFPGMYIPVYIDEKPDGSRFGQVIYERVVKREVYEKTTTVYDLQTEKYNNYIVNGVIVHNSIYVFWGATPEFIVKEMEKNKVELLPKTWRFGESVWNYATQIITYREVPHIECLGESKPVYSVDGEYFGHLLPEFTENTMFLVRAGFMGAILAWNLASLGIPFTGIGGWSDGQIELYNILYKLRKGKTLTVGETRKLVDLFPAETLKVKKAMVNRMPIKLNSSNIDTVFKRHVAGEILYGEQPLRYALNSKISDIGKEKIHGLLARDYGFLSRDKITVKVMTIHASKGLQADTVVVFDDVTSKVIDSLLNEKLAHNEQRTFFVACTRARRRLFIVRGYFRYLNNGYGCTYELPYEKCVEYG